MFVSAISDGLLVYQFYTLWCGSKWVLEQISPKVSHTSQEHLARVVNMQLYTMDCVISWCQMLLPQWNVFLLATFVVYVLPDCFHPLCAEFPKSLKTRKELIEYLTASIFTSSAQHAAVNFGQVLWTWNQPALFKLNLLTVTVHTGFLPTTMTV